MSERDAQDEEFHEDLTAQREAAAEEFDELQFDQHPRDVLGDAIEELVGELPQRSAFAFTTRNKRAADAFTVRNKRAADDINSARELVRAGQNAADHGMRVAAQIMQIIHSGRLAAASWVQEGQDVAEEAERMSQQVLMALNPLVAALDLIDAGRGGSMSKASFDRKIADVRESIQAVDRVSARADKFLIQGYSASRSKQRSALRVLGDAIVEFLEPGDEAGSLQFQGKEDYIRGETECLHGMDIVGTVPGRGALGGRMVTQMQPAGFVPRQLSGGKSFLSLKTRPTKALDHDGAINKARMVAKDMKMVSASLKNFNSERKKGIVGEADWLEIAGEIGAFAEDLDVDGVTVLVGDAADAFDDVVGAIKIPKRGKRKIPSDAEVRRLAKELSSLAYKLEQRAGKHAATVAKQKAKVTALTKGAIKATAAAAARKPLTLSKTPPISLKAASMPGRTMTVAPSVVKAISRVVGDVPTDPSDPAYNDFWGITPEGGGGGGGGGYQPSGDTGYAPTGDYTEPELPPGPEDNYGMGPPPTLENLDTVAPLVPGVDFTPDPYGQAVEDQKVYRSVGDAPAVPGAMYYVGSPALSSAPNSAVGSVGSRSFWQGGDGFGFFGNGNPLSGNPRAIGWRFRDGEKFFIATPVPPQFTSVQDLATNSESRGWGPIVGQPGKDVGNLRFDVAKNAFFWFLDKAPQELRNEERATRLNKAILEYQTELGAAKNDYVKAVAQAKTRKEEADQRARDWARQQETMQQDQTKFEQQQLQQQAQLEMQYAQQEQQLAQQYAQLDVQREQAETRAYDQWLQQGGAQQEGGGGWEQEGGWQQEAGPFDDVDRGAMPVSRGGGGGPWDDLAPEELSDSFSMMDDQPIWDD